MHVRAGKMGSTQGPRVVLDLDDIRSGRGRSGPPPGGPRPHLARTPPLVNHHMCHSPHLASLNGENKEDFSAKQVVFSLSFD